ncbi:SET domain-containing protein [Rhizopus microsporus var. microsporus]|uniref:Histone-lysine N-methyltransferase SET5 n=2 Tax=Rhizopus microsporus TaxID=58291 RepID=A0A2G4STX6_RHIZD|nr:SET domain-containing protein [Rhizopus microsporus ATCC 52813]ORE11498.1 SET domain-containing protein [Rhizopus microsporus var. microsporus]PHZ12202.1 SET domain-containing protein [Rhizopus microsporus ATCC 52813]
MTDKIIPSEEALVEAIQKIKLETPEAGIKKVTTLVLEQQPSWQVSEKRVKKHMQQCGLTQTTQPVKSGLADDPSVPVSYIDPRLDFKSVSDCVQARMVDPVTGKGLFAARDIKRDEILFTEEPFVYFPPWELFALARSGNACGLCCKPILYANRLTQHCKYCDMYYCSKQCRSTAWEQFHQLECTRLNPAVTKLMNFCEGENWQAPMAIARIYARMILAHQRDELNEVLGHLDAFATVSQEERQAKETEWIFMEHPTRELWVKARDFLSKAYKEPPAKCKITKALPDTLKAQLFDDEKTFLNYMGKFNINNQNGGLYLVHSHINHNCYPNVSIDHPQAKSQYKIAVRAIRDIKQGEQLYETYVNPRWNKETRQTYLDKSYLFKCQCDRCEKDLPLTDDIRKGLRLRDE